MMCVGGAVRCDVWGGVQCGVMCVGVQCGVMCVWGVQCGVMCGGGAVFIDVMCGAVSAE